ncbi:TPA: hypothetical protein SLG40_003287 [Serratia odorifera]|jgi:hypothetical protein|uniref:hypothetical protein n=1 Tax=Enterobacter roggenkampii TaxID=1812935 RepID=UPI001285C3DB|nr:hypothetical protein [Enterobacter roggenkampii]ECE0469530.1 hypothetical protein [Salmonella enterica subsp. enterica serovar Glostrup]BEO49937.1 hypothetical protein SMQE20_44960 [Serratia marcescens]HBQ0450497.1 hypothetical protein [Klebsiella pneumoniae]HEI8867749.1 hypothetical protein [Serratia odorifera]EHA9229064.1 hypothetical protein [Salmonella enterica subsp. enterica serovar Glostrup]
MKLFKSITKKYSIYESEINGKKSYYIFIAGATSPLATPFPTPELAESEINTLIKNDITIRTKPKEEPIVQNKKYKP